MAAINSPASTTPAMPRGLTRSLSAMTRIRPMRVSPAAGVVTTYTYNSTSSGPATTVTTQKPGGPSDVAIDHYRTDGSLEYQEHAGQIQSYLTDDSNLAANTVVDGNGQ